MNASRARQGLTLAGAALAVVMAVVLFREAPDAGAPRAAAGEAEDAEASRAVAAPVRVRDDYPVAAAEVPPPAAEAQGARSNVPAPASRLPGASIRVASHAPPAPHQTASAWIHEYSASVCACTTRECVRALQTRFIHAMNTTDYDEGRDGQAYVEGSRRAVRCLAALPSDS
jgi:hypothetical protein